MSNIDINTPWQIQNLSCQWFVKHHGINILDKSKNTSHVEHWYINRDFNTPWQIHKYVMWMILEALVSTFLIKVQKCEGNDSWSIDFNTLWLTWLGPFHYSVCPRWRHTTNWSAILDYSQWTLPTSTYHVNLRCLAINL